MAMIEQSVVGHKYTKTGKISGYTVELYHKGLDETRHLSASEMSVLRGKINNQNAIWNKKYERQVAIEYRQNKDEQAQELTAESKAALEAVKGLLAYTLKIDDAVDWETVKNKEPFPTAKPMLCALASVPPEPDRSKYLKKVPLMKTLHGQAKKFTEAQELAYEKTVDAWQGEKKQG